MGTRQPFRCRSRRRAIAFVAAVLAAAVSSCGFGSTPTFDEAFPDIATPEPTATAVPAVVAAEQPVVPDQPTATPAPTATPEPEWRAVNVSDGVTFELPWRWTVTDDQAAVDAEMLTPETLQGLADAGMTGPMDLFEVEVRALATGPEGERMFYVTVGNVPFATLELLSSLGEPLVENFGIDVVTKQPIATELGTGLRVETVVADVTYLAWIWIEDGEGRIVILTTLDPAVERQLITTLAQG